MVTTNTARLVSASKNRSQSGVAVDHGMLLAASRRLRLSPPRGSRQRCTTPGSEEEEAKRFVEGMVKLPLLPGAVLGLGAGAVIPDQSLPQQLGVAAAAGTVASLIGIAGSVLMIPARTHLAGSVWHVLVGPIAACATVLMRAAVVAREPAYAPLAELEGRRARELEVRVGELEARLSLTEVQLTQLREVLRH